MEFVIGIVAVTMGTFGLLYCWAIIHETHSKCNTRASDGCGIYLIGFLLSLYAVLLGLRFIENVLQSIFVG